MKIRYRSGYKYQLAEDYTVMTPIVTGEVRGNEYFVLFADGRLLIRKGYAWNGADGPTFDTASSMRPSLGHDVLCQMMRTGLLEHPRWSAQVHGLFREMCLEDGMLPIRAAIWHRAVVLADGGNPEHPDPNPIFEAP